MAGDERRERQRLVECDPAELASRRLRQQQVPTLDGRSDDPGVDALALSTALPVGPDGGFSLVVNPAAVNGLGLDDQVVDEAVAA